MTVEECIEANRQVVEAFVRAPAAVALVEEVVLKDLAQNCTYRGRAAVVALLRAFFVEGFAQARAEVQTMLVGECAAMLEFVFHGRQDGLFMGIPATGREVAIPMVLVCRIAAEKIQQAALYYDAGSLLRQLGMAI
ncbi:MAG: ester cyclase [Chloroflexi bacterium]|nr:ester cyclase [Chloroflexota bacterium]MCI0578408.1 ester cyclase [Chloroflexota bacterium]MCI0648148.1 ester cyclase [Chloroflexota bacterium]MCI0726663.1 ester cyclase [Chloroflexota bacterium]